MDLKQLRALVTIAETGNVTKAAELLNIVQPAVSRQLKLLEEDVGTPLFDRESHGMKLNEAGTTLVEYARRILHEVDKARAEIRPSQNSVSGIVTIGLLPSTCDLLSSALIGAIKKDYPEIRVRISTGYAGHLQDWLSNGEIDAALLYDTKPSPSIQIEPLLEERLWVIGLPDSGLKKKKLSIGDLTDRPFILPSQPHGLRSLVDQACKLLKIELNVAAETNSLNVQKSLVLGGNGVTILPSIAVADELARQELVGSPLQDDVLTRKIVLATPTTRRITPAARCVTTELTRCMKDKVSTGSWPGAKWIGQ
jgi:LysR family nitrogen assimilation transcriptional regulator